MTKKKIHGSRLPGPDMFNKAKDKIIFTPENWRQVREYELTTTESDSSDEEGIKIDKKYCNESENSDKQFDELQSKSILTRRREKKQNRNSQTVGRFKKI